MTKELPEEMTTANRSVESTETQSATGAMSSAPGADERELVMERIFDAPRELVWKAFTEPERVAQW